MKTAIIIPARLESTRLPRKLLLDQTGKTLIEHTYLAASQSAHAAEIWVATDSVEIKNVVEGFGGRAVMTASDHQSGTDRVAEVAASLEADLIVNVQGDEPEIEAAAIDQLVDIFETAADTAVATLATPIRQYDQLMDPACVKVVLDADGKALYFSRSPIPMSRDPSGYEQYFQSRGWEKSCCFLQHLGLYAYRKECLLKITRTPQSTAEKLESLEQLRFLDQGWPVRVGIVAQAAMGIDTPEDYALFVNRFLKR